MRVDAGVPTCRWVIFVVSFLKLFPDTTPDSRFINYVLKYLAFPCRGNDAAQTSRTQDCLKGPSASSFHYCNYCCNGFQNEVFHSEPTVGLEERYGCIAHCISHFVLSTTISSTSWESFRTQAPDGKVMYFFHTCFCSVTLPAMAGN
jgi:hypothetical protein